MKPRAKKIPKPLDETRLRDFALNYVGKYATCRKKLELYLRRKLGELGWVGENPADIEAVLIQFEELGYIDDAQYARMRAGSLSRRGYGERRISQELRHQGISQTIADDLLVDDETNANASDDAPMWGGGGDETLDHVRSALTLARKKHIGPFANEMAERALKEKHIAKMIRAGHSFALARYIADLPPGTPEDEILHDAPKK